MIRNLQTTTLAIAFLLGLSCVSDAEYFIYLKGGHFIVADDCTFSTSQGVGKGPEAGEQSDCTKGKPKGQIFWSTINGDFGEVNADDVYAISGTKGTQSIPPWSTTTLPLEDYLISNRGESFVNAKVVEEKDVEIFGLKRDELSKINRRGVIEIAPESVAKSQSGAGLCPGEPLEFALGEIEIVGSSLIVDVVNLSKEPWEPSVNVEVRVKGRPLGKFQIEDVTVHEILPPGGEGFIDSPVPDRFRKELGQLKDPEAGVRLCYRRAKPKQSSPGKVSTEPSAK